MARSGGVKMRNLTIKRIKSFVGCLAKMKIYVEDHFNSEITINDIPCRKIGELKNGETKTFQIDENALKVFVIADKISKEYCNEYYQLNEGQEDVFLSGKNKFNIANGNAFRFDNNNNAEINSNRKKGTLKGAAVLVSVLVLSSLIGYSIGSCMLSGKTSKAKTFSSNGMNITLTDEFKETKVENFTVAYDSKNVAVLALREPFSLVEGFENHTLEQYANLVIKANNLSGIKPQTADGLTYFEYNFTNPETKDEYTYFSYAYKADDAFWMVQFATLSKNADEYKTQITDWAKLVNFSK